VEADRLGVLRPRAVGHEGGPQPLRSPSPAAPQLPTPPSAQLCGSTSRAFASLACCPHLSRRRFSRQFGSSAVSARRAWRRSAARLWRPAPPKTPGVLCCRHPAACHAVRWATPCGFAETESSKNNIFFLFRASQKEEGEKSQRQPS
jgi:hypothetical protein